MGLEGGGGQRQALSALPPGKDTVHVVLEAGWAPGPVRTGTENLDPHQDSIPDSSSPQRVAISTELSRPPN